jgi:hypothetical protein
VWIAVLGSVKLFPNLEAALKGVFNRVLTVLWLGGENYICVDGAKAIAEALKVNAVLKNLRKASARFHREVRLQECSRKLLAMQALIQTPAAHTKVSHARSSCQK